HTKLTHVSAWPQLGDVGRRVGKRVASTFEPVDGELAERTLEELRKVYDVAYETCTSLVEQGVERELARSVLPVGAYTEFYWTVNARSIMNFVSLRAAETAQREIRRYAFAIEAFLAREMPVTHAAFVANDRIAPQRRAPSDSSPWVGASAESSSGVMSRAYATASSRVILAPSADHRSRSTGSTTPRTCGRSSSS